METILSPQIPKQKKGGSHNTESKKYYGNKEAASEQFELLKGRFYKIHLWKDYCGGNFADFHLYDSLGNYTETLPQIEYYIRIDIPGPGTVEAKGYDWVRIVEMNHQYSPDKENEDILMICRPCRSPLDTKKYTSHFYSSKATSSFLISRKGTCIKAGIYGRNEMPNLNAVFIDKLRNIFVALGAMIGIAKIQWKTLTDGLLNF
ncbi:hypothetical protein CMU89_00775 [Elizabethkingia anophelis]|nr:hypothetical protein [Elizabethkingia anophelis]MDV3541205.1 hypothetical protein [Elizabethkingia anophelis]